jgi:hypothetical protein
MENTWEIHKDEAWLLQDALQSEKQRRNHNFSYKKIIGEYITSRLVRTDRHITCTD